MRKRGLVLVALILLGTILAANQQIAFNSRYLTSSPLVDVCFAQAYNETQNQTQTIAMHEFDFDRQFYIPTKISLNYPYTNSHDVMNVTTVGASQYKYEIQPISFNFIVSDIDVFTFTLDLRYDNATSRQILIGVWEGDRPMEGYLWTESATEYVMHFRVSTTTQPAYPTGEEVANLTFLKFQELYVQQLEENRQTLAELSQSQYINTILTLVAVSLAIFALFLAGFGYKQRRIKGENE